MEGKINNFGGLVINRGSRMLNQYCKYRTSDFCTDTCPHFGEPRYGVHNEVVLPLCDNHNLFFKSFTDERKKDGTDIPGLVELKDSKADKT